MSGRDRTATAVTPTMSTQRITRTIAATYRRVSALGDACRTIRSRQDVLGGLGVLGDRDTQRGVDADATPSHHDRLVESVLYPAHQRPHRLLVGDGEHDEIGRAHV